jgi:thiamine-phosphate pyrophosphorylase
LREKGLDGAELLRRARELRELTKQHGVLLAINDRPDIARLCGADIVHVGQGDLAVREVRRVAGAQTLVGKSTHTVAQFEAARTEEPDYLAVGPMFDSTTKPQEHIAGLATLRVARGMTELPLVAIGGIAADTAADVYGAGANVVAVCREVIASVDPEAAARSVVAKWHGPDATA